MFNPTFGQNKTPQGFGPTNPFGQSTMFNKPTTTGFAQPAFGATGNTGLFGSTLPSSGTLFGSSTTTPAFGQAPTTQSSFAFGATAPTTTNLFGAQPTTGTGLFGASQNAFSQNKPAFGQSFGATPTTGLFGAQQQPAATPLFGAAASSPFGASTSGFGATAAPTGTVIKFNPVTGTDTFQKGTTSTQINTRHYCITCMKEYESKSLEELRYEDYLANRKGPQQGATLFGAPAVQPSVFGSTGTTGVFGAQPTENKSLFGTSAPNLVSGFGTNTGAFGSQTSTGSTLFGAKPTGFGAPTTSSTGFGFGSTPSTGLFSAAQPAFGAATATPSLFGQTSTAQPSTSFGGTPAFGSGFAAPQNQSIGLFGAQNKPATSFGLGTSAPSTGFSFGQATTAGTSLFASKPATPGFGAPSFGTTTSTFGAPSTGANLFNKPASLNFSFGGMGATTGANTLSTGSSLFGNNQQKPGGLFGTGTSTGLFNTNTGGFGTTGTTFGQPSTGLGGSTLGAPSLFGTSAPASAPNVAPTAHSALLALASLPFADSPLYKSLLPSTKKADNAQKTNALTQKAIITASDMKVSPKTETKIKLKPLMVSQVKKSLFEGLDEVPVASAPVNSVRTLTLKPRPHSNQSLSDSLSEAVSSNKENRRVSFSLPLETPVRERESEPFHIRRNPLFKSNFSDRQNSLDDIEPAASSTIVESEHVSGDIPKAKTTALSPHNILETPTLPRGGGDRFVVDEDNEEGSANSSKQGDTTASSNNSRSLDETHGYLNDSSGILEDRPTGKTGIILRRVDYYTIPSIDELEQYVADDGSCIVDDFCIGRAGYGNIYYEEPMDVAGLDIDSIVHFRHKEVTVYPDESNKPPVGTGLNRKCQVTLERVFPIDKKSREPIVDPQQLMDLRYEEKLRRCTSKLRAHFVEYRPLTGSWVFKVDHFSKYGLDDSEDEIEEVLPTGVQPPKPPVLPKPQATPSSKPGTSVGGKTNATAMLSPISPPKQQCFSLADKHSASTFPVQDQSTGKSQDVSLDVDMDDDGDLDDDAAADLLDSPWGLPGSKVDSHRVQLMKSSLFHSHAADELEDLSMQIQELSGLPSARLDISRGIPPTGKLPTGFQLPLFTSDTYDMGASYFSPRPADRPLITLPVPRPKTASLKHQKSVIPLAKSSMGHLGSSIISDIAFFKGRSFRPGWALNSCVSCLTTEKVASRLETNLEGRLITDFTPTHVQMLSLYSMDPVLFRETIEKHLEIQLEFCLRGDENGCPIISPSPGVAALHRHCLLANELVHLDDSWLSYSKQVWNLCGALWGELPALSPEDEPTSHRTIMMRREALTEWLRTCAVSVVEKELENLSDVKALFSQLTGHQVSKACESAQAKGEHFAALLLSSGPSARPLVQSQLQEWTDVAADRYIEHDRLKVYTLAAGLPVAQTSFGLVNTCQGLDWRRVFALHFWYICSPVSGIPDVVAKYESSFSGDEVYADPPHPPYCDDVRTSEGQIILDLCFHLLKLFSTRSHPLEPLLNPATHTADPLDLRLSWLLEQNLAALGYSHISALSSAITSIGFAAQLEAYGLWHWAIFVLLHLKDGTRRQKVVEEYLHRHVSLLEDRELTTKEDFVVWKLGVPQEWVFSAKAVKALSAKSYDDAAHYLLEAGEWNRAHELIIQHIAPDLVINENVVDLEGFLVRLVPHSRAVAEWTQQGQLLLDFLDIRRSLARALEERDTGQLEARLPQLASVCDRVVKWPTPTVKHRLCQAEIAKKTAHIYLNVKRLDCTSSAMRDARSLISRLPLPDDYLLEEMELVTRAEQEVH